MEKNYRKKMKNKKTIIKNIDVHIKELKELLEEVEFYDETKKDEIIKSLIPEIIKLLELNKSLMNKV